MILKRIVKLDESEIKDIIKKNLIICDKNSSWSGENAIDTFEVAEHISGIEVYLTFEASKKDIKRPNDYDKYMEILKLNKQDKEIPSELEEYQSDEKCKEDLDEYNNIQEWNLKLKDIKEIMENINEYGFDSWITEINDTGCIELELEL